MIPFLRKLSLPAVVAASLVWSFGTARAQSDSASRSARPAAGAPSRTHTADEDSAADTHRATPSRRTDVRNATGTRTATTGTDASRGTRRATNPFAPAQPRRAVSPFRTSRPRPLTGPAAGRTNRTPSPFTGSAASTDRTGRSATTTGKRAVNPFRRPAAARPIGEGSSARPAIRPAVPSTRTHTQDEGGVEDSNPPR